MTQSLLAVKSLAVFFYNWTNDDYNNLILSSPNEKIMEDISYVFKQKLLCYKEKQIQKMGGLSNCLMSEFFMKLNEDSAEYVLQYALMKNKGMYL